MPALIQQLDIEQCPHCQVDKPLLTNTTTSETTAAVGGQKRRWKCFTCSRCGGVVTAAAESDGAPVQEMYPSQAEIDERIPEAAKEYLSQAVRSLIAPAGAVMLASSAVDAMLKAKGYKEGTLYSRINEAAADNLITDEMALWAHGVRLMANEPRHADEEDPMPDMDDARRSTDFVCKTSAKVGHI